MAMCWRIYIAINGSVCSAAFLAELVKGFLNWRCSMIRMVLVAVVLAASSQTIWAQDLKPVTKEDLVQKVPSFFSWVFGNDPKSGQRLWLRR